MLEQFNQLSQLTQLPLHFALVVFRIAGLMVFAPVVGSDKIPRTVKFYTAVAMALCVCSSPWAMPRPESIPDSPFLLIAGIAGEILFGLLAGLLLSLVFITARWAGGIAGQQMGFNMAGNFNPTADFGGNPLGDVYFILTLLIFLSLDAHTSMMVGVFRSFEAVPPLSFALNTDLLDLFVNTLGGATGLAMRIAAPVCTAMLVVDLSLGMLGKTIPSLNLLSVGLSIRAGVGLILCIFGLYMTSELLVDAINNGLLLTEELWLQPPAQALAQAGGAGG